MAAFFPYWFLGGIEQKYASRLGIPFGIINLAFDTRQIVVVMVEAFRGGQVAAFYVCGRIPDAVAGGPLLMALEAREGAGPGGTSWAAVLVGFGVAAEVLSEKSKMGAKMVRTISCKALSGASLQPCF